MASRIRALWLCAVVFVPLCSCATSHVPPPPAPVLVDQPGRAFDWPADDGAARSLPPLPSVTAAAPARAGGLPSPGNGADDTLYVIGGRSIGESDLGRFMLRYFPDHAREALIQLVDVVLVEAEAARLGVTADERLVREKTSAYVEERARQTREQYGEDARLSDLLEEKYGRDLARFTRDAERLARVAVLRDVLVRYDQAATPRATLRVLVAPDEAAAADLADRLRRGADPVLLARSIGMEEPVSPPPLARDEIRPDTLGAAVFGASPGEVIGPFPFTAEDGTTWFQVVRVVARTDGSGAGYPTLAEAVGRDIASRPVGVDEYLAWRQRALARRSVEVRREAGRMVPWIENAPIQHAPRSGASK